MRKWFGVAAVALVATTSLAQQDADGSLAKLPPAIRDKALETLDLRLVDGPSARLRQVRLEGERTICGLINAKTKAGSYTGFIYFFANVDTKLALFMSAGATASTVSTQLDEVTDDVIRRQCALPPR